MMQIQNTQGASQFKGESYLPSYVGGTPSRAPPPIVQNKKNVSIKKIIHIA